MAETLFYVLASALILEWFAGILLGAKKDDSDGVDEKGKTVHSRMTVLTDHKTGRQYLMTKWGGITPRLDK